MLAHRIVLVRLAAGCIVHRNWRDQVGVDWREDQPRGFHVEEYAYSRPLIYLFGIRSCREEVTMILTSQLSRRLGHLVF